MSLHALSCEAPLCAQSAERSVVWYAGEPICSLVTPWQQNQRKINKLVSHGTFKRLDIPYTKQELAHIKRVVPARSPLFHKKGHLSPIEARLTPQR